MVVFVNGLAAGGSGLARWRKVQPALSRRFTDLRVCVMNGSESTRRTIEREVCAGETRFIAAGGDGTVNFLANSLIEVASADQRPGICLGAVGIGSSNDFHKPLGEKVSVEGIPMAVDFEHARERDVGRLTCVDQREERRRYFLVNASIGVTANANAIFNSSDATLAVLKRWCTGGAILYAALQAIARHQDIPVTIESQGAPGRGVHLSNLGVVKNPWFSGNLCYGGRPDYQDGLFGVHLCHSMKGGELLQLLGTLQRGGVPVHNRKIATWKTPAITVSCPRPFAVECDGEIVTTMCARFEVVPRYLRVCP